MSEPSSPIVSRMIRLTRRLSAANSCKELFENVGEQELHIMSFKTVTYDKTTATVEVDLEAMASDDKQLLGDIFSRYFKGQCDDVLRAIHNETGEELAE